MNSLKKYLLIGVGLLCVGLGFLGIFLPGFPTTPFLLLASGCFVRSSEKLYNWLISNQYFGKSIQKFQEEHTISVRAKIISLASMWTMISVSIIFLLDDWGPRISVMIIGFLGSFIILRIKTEKKSKEPTQ